MLIKETTKLSDVVHYNFNVLPILNRFNIQLGFGDKNVKEVCNELNVNVQFFLEIVNSFLDENYFPQSELQSFSIKSIINYIKNSHNHYVEFKVPQIEKMISELLGNASDEKKQSYQLIKNFFSEYKKEFMAHIEHEDIKIHPYVLEVDEVFRSKDFTEKNKENIRKNPIAKYADEHDDIEEKLFDLKNLMIKYLPPCKDYTLSNAILFELFRLERDLNDHSRIEEKVLIPKIEAMEKIILEG